MSVPTLSIAIFWLIGLFAIGFVARLLAGSITIETNKDQEAQRLVVGWCTGIAILWIVVGGSMVFAFLLKHS